MDLEALLDIGAKEDLTGVLAPIKEADESKKPQEPQEPKDEKESPSDKLDDGEPEKNNTGALPPSEAKVIPFNPKSDTYKEFDNYYEIGLELDGKVWPTVEHYFQAAKYPQNPEYQEQIRKAKTGSKAKTMGRDGEGEGADWETRRLEVMERAVREKFSDRHPKMKAKLLETKDALLQYDAQDNFWGIGRKKVGANQLGKILMKIRKEYQDSQEGGDKPRLTIHMEPIVYEPLKAPIENELPAPIPVVNEPPAAPIVNEPPAAPTVNAGDYKDIKIVKVG